MSKKKLITILSFTGFVLILFLVLNDSISTFDSVVYNKVYSLRNPFFDFFFTNITRLANTVPVIIILIILFTLLEKEDRDILGSSFFITVVVNQVLKFIVKRIRPDHIKLIEQNGYSFPSGHAMVSLCIFGVCIYLIRYKVKNEYLKVLYITLLSLLILLIGISRIYVGVHYPSDVLAGYLLTMVVLIVNITLFHRYYRGNLNDKNDRK